MAERIDSLAPNTEIMAADAPEADNIAVLKQLVEGAAQKAGLTSTDLTEIQTVSDEVAEVMVNGLGTLMNMVGTLMTDGVGSVSILTEMAESAVVGATSAGRACRSLPPGSA